MYGDAECSLQAVYRRASVQNVLVGRVVVAVIIMSTGGLQFRTFW